MRLGIDASNLRGGGGITHLVGILRAAQPHAHGIERIIVWAGTQTIAQLPRQPWLELVRVPLLDRSLPARLYWRRFKLKELARQQCDVLLTPGGGFTKSGRPVVTMFRNMLPFESSERRRYGFSWMFLRLLLLRHAQSKSFRKADGIIFLNQFAKSKILGMGSSIKARMAVIPHGIDESFRNSPRAQKPLQTYSLQKPFRFLYVSIVDVYKHQWCVARAVAKLRNEGLPIALDLVGPSYAPALHRLEKVLREVDPGGEFISYHGPVPLAQLPETYSKADAFVFASSCENMPNIVMEAMAAGLPIASSDHDPIPEILGRGSALYFDPEDPEAIANVLRQLVADATLRDQLASAAFHASAAYSWVRCAHETLDFIKSIAPPTTQAIAA